MLGGFLGSGKTTTLLRLAQYLQRQKKRVGLITNDQAAGLVDTALMEELNLPVREIAGGCFCCRSESLVEALGRLTEESQPEVFLAEPVGSCTDLVATVSLPLERIYKAGYVMAPYAVLIDPYRAMQTLGVEGESLFSPDVNYIYRKQLEEAEIIVINKTDVVSAERLARLRDALSREYPEAEIMAVASRDGSGLEPLFTALTTREGQTRRVMEVDYERYGRGEAMLGWLNSKAEVRADSGRQVQPMDNEETGTASKKLVGRKPPGRTVARGIDGNAWLMDLAGRVQSALRVAGVEIAHFKMTLAAEDGQMAAVSLVRTDGEPELRRKLERPLSNGSLLVNLRAEGAPELLAATVQEALRRKARGVSVKLNQTESFRPGQPVPTHRVAAA